jgi:hypothetical protein
MASGLPLRAAIIRSSSRKGTLQAVQRGVRGLHRAGAAGHLAAGQKRHGFGVGLRLLGVARGGEVGAQLAEVLDDAVVHHRDRACLVRVGIGDGGRTMGGPAGVADAGLAGQRLMHQQVGQVHQLAHGAAAVEPAVVDGGDPGAVVAAVFQPLQRLDQQGGRLVVAQNADDAAHQFASLLAALTALR